MKISDAVCRTRPRPALERLLQFLKALPPDEVFTNGEIRIKGRICVGRAHTYPELSPYRQLHAGTVFWGSERAIKTFRESLRGAK